MLYKYNVSKYIFYYLRKRIVQTTLFFSFLGLFFDFLANFQKIAYLNSRKDVVIMQANNMRKEGELWTITKRFTPYPRSKKFWDSARDQLTRL